MATNENKAYKHVFASVPSLMACKKTLAQRQNRSIALEEGLAVSLQLEAASL